MKSFHSPVARALVIAAGSILLAAGVFAITQNLVAAALVALGAVVLGANAYLGERSLQDKIARGVRETKSAGAATLKEASRATYHANRASDRAFASHADVLKLVRGMKSEDGAIEESTRVLRNEIRDLATTIRESERRTASALGALNKSLPGNGGSPAVAPTPPTTSEYGASSLIADMKAVRTGKPAKQVPVANEIAARDHSPIRGEDARAWIASKTGGPAHVSTTQADSPRREALPYADEVVVAMIADDFTYNSFGPEFTTHRLTPKNWRDVFEREQPQLFFCESAWQGGAPKDHPWQGKVYASVRWPVENRTVLLEILDHCHRNGIPTVFWNKEDPTHFGDRINDFIRTAVLFDYVFTTAEECVPAYKKDAGAAHADVLPFAVQPKLFNPKGTSAANDEVNFAGTWYGMYPDRCARAGKIMDLVLESGRDLVIYDRMHDSRNPIYQFPERFRRFTRPTIPYEQTAEVYKRSKFGITLNTVTDSRTMFARRVFELAASGAVVLSNYSVGVENFFGDSVIFADRDPDRFRNLTEGDYTRLQEDALGVALNNTYRHRAETILNTVGIRFQSRGGKPAAFATVSTEREYDRVRTAVLSSKALDGLIVAVAANAEQSLEMKLGMRRDEGVVITSVRALAAQELRTRNLLEAHGVIVCDASTPLVSDATIERLVAHTQYHDGLVGPQQGEDSRYRFRLAERLDGVYVPATEFASVFARNEPHAVYRV